MEGTKFLASQAKSIYHYKSIRSKVLKWNADIFCNKQCLAKNIIPKYANIKVPATSKAAHTTQKKVRLIRIKDEIKFLYMKKEQLNKKTVPGTPKVAQEWGNTWHIIRNSVHESINKEMYKKYNNIKQKLNKLEHTQTSTPKKTCI
jgi:hypothetical protein